LPLAQHSQIEFERYLYFEFELTAKIGEVRQVGDDAGFATRLCVALVYGWRRRRGGRGELVEVKDHLGGSMFLELVDWLHADPGAHVR
jgi:hypothetical protein